MTIDIGVIPESELDLLVSAVRFVEPSEENGFGLLVTCVDGIRTWQMNMYDMWVTIRGEKHSFEGSFVIPGRLYVGSAAFGDADHSCNISIEGNIAESAQSLLGEVCFTFVPDAVSAISLRTCGALRR